uniref:Putative ovule protein n=1 Tax=Solanum chacoense TaxID=4108 RepID=A0A0V0IE94_SOLCH
MEGMSSLINTAKAKDWIRGFQVQNRASNNLEITHLQFADDTLVFCEAVRNHFLILRTIFIIFEAVSGLHINWGKSYIYPINEVVQIEELANTLGGQIGELPTIYLGMPLGAKSKSISIWSGVIEKCERKLANWKSQYLSRGGRLTMISSVLDALPTYMMSVFPAPAGVIDRIEVLRRTFFWQGNEDKRKYHLVKWEEMNISKKIGGVGIRNMKFQNQSLMMKWLWKFASAENSLWKEVIAAKYGMRDKWMTTKVTSPYGSSVWRSISDLWDLVLERSYCKVGNGRKVAFWMDKWCGQVPLSQRFPDLYDLCQMQQATVAELWNDQGWNLHFRRNLNDWEMCRITEFLVTLAQFSNLSEEEDSLVWNVGSKGCFTVNSAYEDLNTVGIEEVEWPWKMIWKTKIPYKVNCFTWLLAKETVLTHENLNKRGVHLCSRCFLCEEQGETVNHLFLHCKWTTQLWQMFTNMREIKWVKPGRIKEVLKCWNRDGNAGRKEERWKMVPSCIWWTVWLERNQRCHEGKQSNIQRFKLKCLALYYFWCKQVVLDSSEVISTTIDWL